jgi:hypothetical protein
MGPAVVALAIALVAAVAVAARATVKNAALKEAVRRLEQQASAAERGNERIHGLDASVRSIHHELQGARSELAERETQVRALLTAVRESHGKVVERVDDLVGRWQNPKRRSQLGEGWLIAALKRMGLTHGVHFTTQRRVELRGPTGPRTGVIDVCLTLPDGQELALDDKFPWPRFLIEVLGADAGEETRTLALRKLRDTLRVHIKEMGARGYAQALNADIRHVLVVVPDWQTLELVKSVDPRIGEFAVEHGVGLLPQDALYEVASALAQLHREHGWSEKVRELFTPQHADRMFAACLDYLDRLRTAFRRYNSLGEAIEGLRAPLAPNGMLARDVLEPAARAAERIRPELGEEVRQLDEGRVERCAERLETRRAGAA